MGLSTVVCVATGVAIGEESKKKWGTDEQMEIALN